VYHHKKLHNFRFALEKAVNEFGASCLPYPGKGSTISEIIRWFDEEIKVLPTTFVKVNKIFVCYVIVCILWMLYDSDCEHMEGLQSIMASCDASILEDLPPELTKLMGRIVKKWWSEHGLPDGANHLRKEPKVSISSALGFSSDVHLTYVFSGS
jgi:hypothetical protein